MTAPTPTHPAPSGPKSEATESQVRQDVPPAAVGPDGPVFRLPEPPPFPEFCTGSAMYVGGRWSA